MLMCVCDKVVVSGMVVVGGVIRTRSTQIPTCATPSPVQNVRPSVLFWTFVRDRYVTDSPVTRCFVELDFSHHINLRETSYYL